MIQLSSSGYRSEFQPKSERLIYLQHVCMLSNLQIYGNLLRPSDHIIAILGLLV